MNTKALKQKILNLAIHGKLLPLERVEKIRKEEPASILLEKIRAEKQEKIAKGELKKDKKDSFIFLGDDKRHYEKFTDGSIKDIEDEIPFDIPDGWSWVRLNELADIARGGSPRPIENFITDDENGINWIKIGDTASESKYITSAKEKIIPEGKNRSRFVHAGDFLLTNSVSFGRPYILKIDGCIHDGWLVFADIKECLYKDFLYYALSSLYIYNAFSLVAAGSTVKNLKSDTVKQVLFPLPPLAEQQLIVSEIEKIFAQIDLLEQNKTDLQTAIKQAKSKILNLAIHAKLAHQDPNDEPASILLEKIRAEKQEKIAKGELKKDKKDSFIFLGDDKRHYEKFADGSIKDIEDEIPFDIPDGWSWVRIPEISNIIFAGGDKPEIYEKEITESCNIPIFSNGIEKDGLYGYTNKAVVDKPCITISARGTIGYTCIRNEPFVPIVRLITIIPNEIINLVYIKNVFDSLLVVGEGSSIPQLTVPTVKQVLFPLPPLAEQNRIVAKIEEIFAILDRISSELGADI